MIRKFQSYVLPTMFLVCVIYGCLFFDLGSYGLLDTNETFYALSAREMLFSGDVWTPRIFNAVHFEKPVFIYQALIFAQKNLSLDPEHSLRLMSALAGTLLLVATGFFSFVCFRNIKITYWSVLFLATSAEFIVLSRTVLTDIYLALFLMFGWSCMFLAKHSKKSRPLLGLGFAFFSALAMLSKGLIGFTLSYGLFSFLCFFEKKSHFKSSLIHLPALIVFLLTLLPWYGAMLNVYGGEFVDIFFWHENIRRFFVAEHNSLDTFYFYPMSIAAGLLPWSLIGFSCIIYAFKSFKRRPHTMLGFSLLCVIYIFLVLSFSKSKLMSYIFPLMPILCCVGGWWFYMFNRTQKTQTKLVCIGAFLVTFSTIVLFLTVSPIVSQWYSVRDFFKTHSQKEPAMIASKMFVRGAQYYGDFKNAAVFVAGDATRLFYTPHEIPILSTQGQLMDYCREHKQVLAVLRKKEYIHLNNIKGTLKLDLLAEDPVKSIIQIQYA